MFHIYVNRETIKGGRTRLLLKDLSATRVLHYTHISTSVPLSFMKSICMCMCQDGVTRVGHAHTTCSAARCAATSVSATVHASPARRSPDTVSNRGVVAACASQISSFTLFSQRAESVNVLAHPRKKGNVVRTPQRRPIKLTPAASASLLPPCCTSSLVFCRPPRT